MVFRRFLVTGSNGFVGQHLEHALKQSFPDASLLSRSRSSLDLRDPVATDAWVSESKPDVVIHLAAQSSVIKSDRSADITWSTNLIGTTNLALSVARHAPEAIFLFTSTSEVYGASFLSGSVSENTRPVPLNAYAKSKYITEGMLGEVLPPTCQLIVARPFNHTGPGQRKEFVLSSFARQIVRIDLGLQPPRMKVGNLGVWRDFLDVRDVVKAYVALIHKARQLPSRFTVNISSGKARLLQSVMESLQQLSQIYVEHDVDDTRSRAVDLPLVTADPRLLTAVTGWHPSIAFEETLSDLLRYWKASLQ